MAALLLESIALAHTQRVQPLRCQTIDVSLFSTAAAFGHSPQEKLYFTKDALHRLELLGKPNAQSPLFLLHPQGALLFLSQREKEEGAANAPAHAVSEKAPVRSTGKDTPPAERAKNPFSQQEKKKRGVQKRFVSLEKKEMWGAIVTPAHAMGEKTVFSAERKRRGAAKTE